MMSSYVRVSKKKKKRPPRFLLEQLLEWWELEKVEAILQRDKFKVTCVPLGADCLPPPALSCVCTEARCYPGLQQSLLHVPVGAGG